VIAARWDALPYTCARARAQTNEQFLSASRAIIFPSRSPNVADAESRAAGYSSLIKSARVDNARARGEATLPRGRDARSTLRRLILSPPFLTRGH